MPRLAAKSAAARPLSPRAGPSVATRAAVLGGMAATTALAFWSWPYGAVGFSESSAPAAQLVMRCVAAAAWAAHVGEALYARGLARRVDPARVGHWTVEVFLYGIFSLRYLLAMRGRGGAALKPGQE